LLSILSHPAEGLYIVYFEDTPIAAAIMTFCDNTAVYYYGASTSDNLLRKHMPAYLLQWRMIQAAKAAHCKWYDFL
jgi:lipid II:glycine glycyltransferase (peptidoglycan interpeptide bridge formation enzyme)